MKIRLNDLQLAYYLLECDAVQATKKLKYAVHFASCRSTPKQENTNVKPVTLKFNPEDNNNYSRENHKMCISQLHGAESF